MMALFFFDDISRHRNFLHGMMIKHHRRLHYHHRHHHHHVVAIISCYLHWHWKHAQMNARTRACTHVLTYAHLNNSQNFRIWIPNLCKIQIAILHLLFIWFYNLVWKSDQTGGRLSFWISHENISTLNQSKFVECRKLIIYLWKSHLSLSHLFSDLLKQFFECSWAILRVSFKQISSFIIIGH